MSAPDSIDSLHWNLLIYCPCHCLPFYDSREEVVPLEIGSTVVVVVAVDVLLIDRVVARVLPYHQNAPTAK